jgi:hypothetical protein
MQGRLARLERGDLLLLGEALVTLALCSAAIKVLPFRRLAAMAGGRSSSGLPAEGEARARKVRWAVNAWARRVPWRAVCFQRGLAAHLMLRRRGLPSLLHYGAAQAPGEALKAHVWVTLDGADVTGGDEAGRFTRIATFPAAEG